MVTILTFGTFDVFHVGHLNILERARALGERLIVGVSSDALNVAKKGRLPIYSERERMQIVAGLKCVDAVFLEESLEFKGDYLKHYQANVLAMGDDWRGRFDCYSEICKIIYFPRTPSISTTSIIEVVKFRQ